MHQPWLESPSSETVSDLPKQPRPSAPPPISQCCCPSSDRIAGGGNGDGSECPLALSPEVPAEKRDLQAGAGAAGLGDIPARSTHCVLLSGASTSRYAQIDIAATETAHRVGVRHAQTREERLPELEQRKKGP